MSPVFSVAGYLLSGALVTGVMVLIFIFGCQSEDKKAEISEKTKVEQEKEIGRLKDLLKEDPTRWKERHKLGVAYMTMGKNEEAAQEFLEVMSIKPDDTDNLQSLGMAYYKLGKKHKAHFYWRNALEIEPENKFIWDMLNMIEKEKGTSDASMDIEKWARHYKEGQKFYKEKEYEKAAKEFELASKYNPSDSRTYFSIGAVYRAIDKIDEAISAWQNALKFKPDDLMIMKLISLAKEKKERDTAMLKAKEAVEKNPGDWKAHSRLASLYISDKHGRFIDEAEAEYRETIRLNSKDTNSYKQLAEISFYKGQYNDGIGYLEKAAKYLSKDDIIYKRIDTMKLYLKLYKKGTEDWKKGGIKKYDDMAFVSDGFYIDKYEVTNAQYKRFIDGSPNLPMPPHWKKGVYDEGKDNYPVANVDWYMAAMYCKSINKRLPTEKEWEKAARGNEGFEYPWGKIFKSEFVNSDEAGFGRLTPAGSFEEGKSPYGIYDMAGNVKEWTDSEYEKKEGEAEIPFHGGKYKILRGGSFRSNAEEVKSTNMRYSPPTYRDIDVGFRCAKSKQ
jgi:tetratricopeptide (TPR) repeat protein